MLSLPVVINLIVGIVLLSFGAYAHGKLQSCPRESVESSEVRIGRGIAITSARAALAVALVGLVELVLSILYVIGHI